MKIRVLVADDHFFFRESLTAYLRLDPEIEVVGTAINGFEAVQKVHELGPEVVLMDLNMPLMNGLEATKIIKQEVPGVRVLILSFSQASFTYFNVKGIKADGYFVKGSDGDQLIHKIKSFKKTLMERQRH